ncbi:transposase [Streptomyces sp. NPDC058664]|uniref:transposase n=1 Tax=unclassified Streptomyces TaxID=2593676 RepID=UPI00366A033B
MASATNGRAPPCGTRPTKPSSRSRRINWRACGCTAEGRNRRHRPVLPGRGRLRTDLAHRIHLGPPRHPRARPTGRHLRQTGQTLGALSIDGPDPRLVFRTTTGKITADVLLDFLCTHIAGLPEGSHSLKTAPPPDRPPPPRTVVLDNASAHLSRVVKATRPQLEDHGITLYYLPPYSPELNKIERVWRSVKYEDIPIRAYPWIEELQATVEQALEQRNALLRPAVTDLHKTA